jgi:hypothetical protein
VACLGDDVPLEVAMFDYEDPTGTGALAAAGALTHYRALLHSEYRRFGRRANAGFTIPEAFSDLADASQVLTETVTWLGFPRSQTGTPGQIDSDRFARQDEYVEWQVQRPDGRVSRIVFTTEFSEYYEALAEANPAALRNEVALVTRAASVSNGDLFGANFNPDGATPAARATQFLNHARLNRFNNGTDGILFLTHPSSTLGALFHLITECSVRKNNVATNAVCGLVGGACVPERNSDPVVCDRVQQLVRDKIGMTLADPAGVQILRLQGIWKLAGRQIDINDPNTNGGVWRVLRNGRRAILEVPPTLTIVDDPITSGTQVAAKLVVGATVQAAPESALPAWARLGQESSRMLTD